MPIVPKTSGTSDNSAVFDAVTGSDFRAWLDQADGQISVDKNGDHCFVIYGNDVDVSSKRINIMTTIIEDLAQMDEEQRTKAKLETIRWIDKMRDAVDKC
jgi:hypothetical protein